MSMITGKICGYSVKFLASTPICGALYGVASSAIQATGATVAASAATKKVVKLATGLACGVAADLAVDAMIQHAHKNGGFDKKRKRHNQRKLTHKRHNQKAIEAAESFDDEVDDVIDVQGLEEEPEKDDPKKGQDKKEEKDKNEK